MYFSITWNLTNYRSEWAPRIVIASAFKNCATQNKFRIIGRRIFQGNDDPNWRVQGMKLIYCWEDEFWSWESPRPMGVFILCEKRLVGTVIGLVADWFREIVEPFDDKIWKFPQKLYLEYILVFQNPNFMKKKQTRDSSIFHFGIFEILSMRGQDLCCSYTKK